MDIQSFKNFSKTRKGLDKNGNQSAIDYKNYLTEVNQKTSTLEVLEKDKIRQEYINAIEYVLINLTSPAEKAFFKGLDLTNNNNLSSLIPLVASKLKQVSMFIAAERERAKFSVVKYNLKGSEYGTITFAKNLIYTLYNDVNFTSSFTTFPSLSSLNYLDVSLTPYFNSGDDYFDKDYEKGINDPALYNGGKYEDLNLLYFNKDLYFPALSGEIIKNYNSLQSNYLKTDTNKILLTKSKLKIKRRFFSTNIQDLDTKYFLYGEKSESNLIFNIIKDGISLAQENYGSNKFLGNDLVYVTNTDSVSMSGVLVKAAKKYSNILNFRNYTLQAIKHNRNLRNLQQIGGFFLPHKQGLSLALSKYYNYTINTELSGTNVTTDPYYNVNIRGNSKINYPKVWNYEENPSWIVNDIAGQYNWGKVKNSRPYQKFNGYQSYEENNYEYKSGINKTIDSFDFFSGPEKSVWSNSDVYPSKIPNAVPLSEREDSYNVGKDDIYRWQGDIFGNNYALYKAFNNYDEPNSFINRYNSLSARKLSDFEPFETKITSTDDIVYLYRGSEFNTLVQSLCTTKAYRSIDEKKYINGEVKVRTFNNTKTTTLTAAFSSILSKYPLATRQEINNKIITFNIIEDVIIIKTLNYKIMERFKFNIDTNKFEPFYPFQTNLQ